MIPFPDKKYHIIYADPPWEIGYAKETVKGINAYDLPYSTMTDKEIMALPVKEILEDDAILFMWVIDSRIPKVREIMASWGFEYITVGFVWNKKAATTPGNNAILSKYTRKSCEFCFIGRRGKAFHMNPSVDQFVSEPKREHSKKPGRIRADIVRLCGDISRIELFSRDKIEGWDCWGNQVPDSEQRLLRTGEVSA